MKKIKIFFYILFYFPHAYGNENANFEKVEK